MCGFGFGDDDEFVFVALFQFLERHSSPDVGFIAFRCGFAARPWGEHPNSWAFLGGG
jgi:hypothetical protein